MLKFLIKFIEVYISCTKSYIDSVCIHKEIKHLVSVIDNEKEIHIRNNESLDKVTARVISAMGIAALVAISLGKVLLHEKYRIQREREKRNNYFYKGQ